MRPDANKVRLSEKHAEVEKDRAILRRDFLAPLESQGI
jgi:hypothetical protein